MELSDKIALFQDMIGCCHNLYVWVYDSAFHLITSNCPEQAVINDLFVLSCRVDVFREQLKGQETPIILSNEIGLMWVMAPHSQDGELIRTYVLGPFFVDDTPQKNFAAYLEKHGMGMQLQREFMEFLQKLPIISLNRIFEYAVMLCFCLTGKKISVSDLRYHKGDFRPNSHTDKSKTADAHGTYRGEQEMLRMVRQGDLANYKAQMSRMSMMGNLGKLSNSDPLRQMKNTVLVCITLFSRAAIEGGLTPEVSYTLTDYYFQSVEACESITDLVPISHTMQEDFIRRVHRCRTSRLSSPVRACCEYIEMHLEDKLSLSILAKRTGYSANYLTRKFKQETGLTPIVYIRKQRIERAALLLRTTQDDVQSIGERLGFCSQSYFAEHFRKQFGLPPTEYRKSVT